MRKSDTSRKTASCNATNRALEYILDIPLVVSAEIGRTQLMVGELTQLGQGSVIELDKQADQLIEVFVGGKLVALGETVVHNDKYGIRIIKIISQEDRVKQLG